MCIFIKKIVLIKIIMNNTNDNTSVENNNKILYNCDLKLSNINIEINNNVCCMNNNLNHSITKTNSIENIHNDSYESFDTEKYCNKNDFVDDIENKTLIKNKLSNINLSDNVIKKIEIIKEDANNILKNLCQKDITDKKLNIPEEDKKQYNEFNNNLDLIETKITNLLKTEKESIKLEFDNMISIKNSFNELKEKELKKYSEEKLKWLNTFISNKEVKGNEVINLNVGGTHMISTTRNTLIKYPLSAISVLFSGNYKLHKIDGKIFIDRDGEPFSMMINYLRTDKYPIFNSKKQEYYFIKELEFWKIPVIEKDNISSNKNQMFDSEWCAPTLTLENSNLTVKKDSTYFYYI